MQVDLYGSLAKTGRGHVTDVAVMLGLSGEDPVTCRTAAIPALIEAVRTSRALALGGRRPVAFDPATDCASMPAVTFPFHPNALTFTAILDDGSTSAETYYSIGGGFIVQEGNVGAGGASATLPFPIESAADLLRHCEARGLTIPEVVWRNERAWRTEAEIRGGSGAIWERCRTRVPRVSHAEGILPGGLGVVRRAAGISESMLGGVACADADSWIEAIRASAAHVPADAQVGELLCPGGERGERRVRPRGHGADQRRGGRDPGGAAVRRSCFYGGRREPASSASCSPPARSAASSRSGRRSRRAMGGCQAEIGVSSAMAAAGCAQMPRAAPPRRSLMAAEIAMEHHLGLTCDPVGGLVQVPCIERNTMGAIKAITAAHLALAERPGRGQGLARRRDPLDVGDGPGHEHQVQGDVRGRPGACRSPVNVSGVLTDGVVRTVRHPRSSRPGGESREPEELDVVPCRAMLGQVGHHLADDAAELVAMTGKPGATTTSGYAGWRSRMKWRSGLLVKRQALSMSVGPAPSGK